MDSNLQDFADKAVKFASDSGVQYCDARAEQQEKKSILVENDQVEYIKNSDDSGIGIRLVKDGAWSFCSINNPKSFDQIKVAINDAIKNSTYNSENKKNEISLYPNSSKKNKIDFPVLKIPDIEELLNIGVECGKIILNESRIIKSIINPWYTVNSKYFKNSEGSEITQNFTDVVVEMIATAHESGLTQSVNITEGGRGGLEQILDKNKIQDSAKEIASKASKLIDPSRVWVNPDCGLKTRGWPETIDALTKMVDAAKELRAE